MTQLVFVENNRPVTDSLTVAEVFEKNHADVLRDIRNILDQVETEWGISNFAETHYRHPQNHQVYSKYLITEQGFTLLVMGYTGSKAMKFKVDYINEFERMRSQILNSLNQPSYMIDDPIKRAEKWIGEERDRQALLALNKQREEQLALFAPKVALYETAMHAGNNKAIGTVAKMLGYGPYKLFGFLREIKVLRHNNEPYQAYIDRGYFDVRLYSIPHTSGEIENKTQTMVTPKGIDFIHKLLAEHGKVTKDERNRSNVPG